MKCSMCGCTNDAVEFFGDIDQKEGFCAYHAGLIEQYAESLDEEQTP